MIATRESDLTFGPTIQDRSGEPVLRCYYCLKCTAGCPVAFVMDVAPAQLLRLIQLGQKDAVLGSSAVWLCVACEACGTRCPNGIRLAPVFDQLRYMALADGYKPPQKGIYALHRSFLSSIRAWGRVHEATMALEFKARSPFGGNLFADLKVALTLFLKGKFFSLPERIHGLAQVRRLFKRPAAPDAEVKP